MDTKIYFTIDFSMCKKKCNPNIILKFKYFSNTLAPIMSRLYGIYCATFGINVLYFSYGYGDVARCTDVPINVDLGELLWDFMEKVALHSIPKVFNDRK